jgi:hypothetical protein
LKVCRLNSSATAVFSSSPPRQTGQTEQKLGQVERDFIANTGMGFIQPLRK